MGLADAVDARRPADPETVDTERFDRNIMQPRTEQERRQIQTARCAGMRRCSSA